VLDVIQQKPEIIQKIRSCLEGRLIEQSETIIAVMGGDGSLGSFIDDIVKD
jgi:hypothetical protein